MENLSIYYDMKVHDSKNNLVREYSKEICHSFLKQFIQLLYLEFFRQVNLVVKDTGNTDRTLMPGTLPAAYSDNTYTDSGWNFQALVTETSWGELVGIGTTVVTINDYKMETLIAHGTGAGQLQYSAQTFGAPTTDATGSTFIATRVFTNNSPGNVTIQEIGIAVKESTNSYYFQIVRDNLSSPVTLAVGEQLTLNYTWATTI